MAQSEKEKTYYVVQYRDPRDGQIVSLKAQSIEDSPLGLSFIRASNFLFDTNSLVVQPKEEELKKRFENVKSLHLSIYSIVAIEERGLEHSGLQFEQDRSRLVALPRNNDNPGPPHNSE